MGKEQNNSDTTSRKHMRNAACYAPRMLAMIQCVLVLRAGALLAEDNAPQLRIDPAAEPGFHGVNWADGRDNFVDGWIIPSGIDPGADASHVAAQSRQIMSQFKSLLGANTVRLGINPATVNDSQWWPKYRTIIRQAASLNLKVILACWESKSGRDGRIDDLPGFHHMWDRVLREFSDSEYCTPRTRRKVAGIGHILRPWPAQYATGTWEASTGQVSEMAIRSV